MTPQDIIDSARDITNDKDSDLYRKDDDTLLRFVNEGILDIALLVPRLFYQIGDLHCTAGDCEQSVTFADAQAIVDVLSIHGGSAITPFDLGAMNAFNPGWRSDAAGPAVQWSRYEGDLLRFWIYPKAPADQTIDVLYLRNPSTYGLADTITELPASYKPALADYVIGRAEASNDESVLNGRSTQFLNQFAARLKG